MKKETIATAAIWLLISAFLGITIWQFIHSPAQHAGEEWADWKSTTISCGIVACLLFVLRHWLAKKLTRFFLATAMVFALLAEPILHWCGIPHPEGLWLPYLEGGAVIATLARYWQQIKSAVEHWLNVVTEKIRH